MKAFASFLIVVAGSASLATPAFAQATRTWVSGVGDDVNPCSRTAPCKTFAGAISKTAANGEINAIDPGGFGSLTITKSITVDGNGAHASILSANTNGFIINGAGIVVTLRNLSINGAGTAAGNGIRILNAAAVNIDNVTITGLGGTGTAGRGIAIETSAADVRVSVTNSRLYNIANHGIVSAPTAGNVILDVDRTQILRGGAGGIVLIGSTRASISNSVLSSHGSGAGLALEQATATANVANTVISNNGVGIANGTGGASTTRLYGSTVTGNVDQGLLIASGSILSYGTNFIAGNGGNEVPTSASPGQW
jgi:hypothetical protein